MVNDKHHNFKQDEKASPTTLIMRQYYGNENWKLRNEKTKERYKNDPEYREVIKLKSLLSYYKRKEKKMVLEAV